MPKIIIQANQSNADAGRATLTERIVATHLQDDHYAAQLIQRLSRATIDAERLEPPDDGEHGDERHGLRPTRPPGDTVPMPPTHPPGRRGASSADMTQKRPTGVSKQPPSRPRPIAERPDATDLAHGERDHERADARWLHAWSYDALRPTGELLAQRVITPDRFRPSRRLGVISPGSRRRRTSP